jgi:hypothetical protein
MKGHMFQVSTKKHLVSPNNCLNPWEDFETQATTFWWEKTRKLTIIGMFPYFFSIVMHKPMMSPQRVLSIGYTFVVEIGEWKTLHRVSSGLS